MGGLACILGKVNTETDTIGAVYRIPYQDAVVVSTNAAGGPLFFDENMTWEKSKSHGSGLEM